MRLDHEVAGPADGPVVVLAHSIGTSRLVWRDVAGELTAAGARVVRYDHRGHGQSPAPEGPYTLGELAADLVELLDTLDVARAAVAGVSLGGMVAMRAALDAPDRIGPLALCCTSPHLPPPSLWEDRARIARDTGMAELVKPIVARWFAPSFEEREPDAYTKVRMALAATPAEGYAATALAIAEMDLREELGRIASPTLVIGGADDVATPPAEHAAAIADAIPDARLEVVADAGHLAPYERPAEVAALLRDHLLA